MFNLPCLTTQLPIYCASSNHATLLFNYFYSFLQGSVRFGSCLQLLPHNITILPSRTLCSFCSSLRDFLKLFSLLGVLFFVGARFVQQHINLLRETFSNYNSPLYKQLSFISFIALISVLWKIIKGNLIKVDWETRRESPTDFHVNHSKNYQLQTPTEEFSVRWNHY